jgi:hypothetical protein
MDFGLFHAAEAADESREEFDFFPLYEQPPSDVDVLMSRVSQLVKSGDLELIVSDLDSPGDRRELRYRYHSSAPGE